MIEPRTIHIELATPIFNDQKVPVNSFTVNPPTIGARRKASGRLRNGESAESYALFQIDLVASCTNLSAPTVEQMDADVFQTAWDHVVRFLVPAQETT
jgi:Phage tail assembly chaperone proteins, E, or 41 or 14